MGFRDFLASKMMPDGGISVDEALAMLGSGATLVDVRTLDEYVAAHAPGAKLVAPADLADDAFAAIHAGNPLAEPDGAFVFICDTGLRSGHVAKTVSAQGYECAFIAGGLRAWRDAGQFLLPGPPRR